MAVQNGVSWTFTDLCVDTLNTIDAGIAFSLDHHIMVAYKFLMNNYTTGDRVFLSGFSRGAFTARVLAAMVERVGLLTLGQEEMIPTAWEIYKNWEKRGQPLSSEANTLANEVRFLFFIQAHFPNLGQFKLTFSRINVNVHFMGLWDSVNSVGFLYDRIFPYVSHTNIVKHIRHAISIDERRGKFKQYPFFENYRLAKCKERQDGSLPIPPLQQQQHNVKQSCSLEDIAEESDEVHSNESTSSAVPSWSSDVQPPPKDDAIWGELLDTPGHGDVTGRPIFGYIPKGPIHICEDVIELWFPGDHSDVGGGWVPNSDGHAVSNVALRWMIVEAYKAGITFREGILSDFDTKWPLSTSLRAPLHDKLYYKLRSHVDEEGRRGKSSLTETLFWWVLEYLPIFTYKLNPATDKWAKSVGPNLGHHRTIPNDVKFHWSVSWRRRFLGYGPENIANHSNLQEWDDETSVDSLDDLKKLLDENPRL